MITLKELTEIDNKREAVRAEGKNTLREQAKLQNTEAKIVFPKTHLFRDDKQLRYGLPWIYNGFILYLPDLVMAVDPGVDFMYRASISRITLAQINTMYISHGHLDHVAGANILSDFLIRAQQSTQIIAPKVVFEEKEMTPYHAGYTSHHSGWKSNHFATPLENEETITLTHGSYRFTPIKHFHGAECYGFSLEYNGKNITYISDTGYTKKFSTTEGTYEIGTEDYQGEFTQIVERDEHIKEAVNKADYLIVNVESLEYEKNSKTHLTIHDVVDMIKGSQVKLAIIAHCNPMGELRYDEWASKVAEYVSQETGKQVVAPSEKGLMVNL